MDRQPRAGKPHPPHGHPHACVLPNRLGTSDRGDACPQDFFQVDLGAFAVNRSLDPLSLGHFSPILRRFFPIFSPSYPQDSRNRHQDPETRSETAAKRPRKGGPRPFNRKRTVPPASFLAQPRPLLTAASFRNGGSCRQDESDGLEVAGSFPLRREGTEGDAEGVPVLVPRDRLDRGELGLAPNFCPPLHEARHDAVENLGWCAHLQRAHLPTNLHAATALHSLPCPLRERLNVRGRLRRRCSAGR